VTIFRQDSSLQEHVGTYFFFLMLLSVLYTSASFRLEVHILTGRNVICFFFDNENRKKFFAVITSILAKGDAEAEALLTGTLL
jgi:hypothetical protein